MDQNILFEKYLLSAFKFLNYRLRSEKEVRDNLKKKKAPEEVIEKIITHLYELRFLNDEVFARTWIESRNRSKPRSHFVLQHELQQKGIAREIVEKLLTQGETTGISDLDLARDLVKRKGKKYLGLERQAIYQKLGGLLARRGFHWEVSKKAIDEYLNNT